MRSAALTALALVACTRPNPLFLSTAGDDSSGGGGGASDTSGSDVGTVTTDDATSAAVTSTGGGSSSTAATITGSTGCGDGCACTPGETELCYSGPQGTEGVGVCAAGQRTCKPEGTFGPCEGEILPALEVCGDGLDNECDAAGIDLCEPPFEGCPEHPALIACYPFPKAAVALLDGSGYKRDGTLTGVGDAPSVMGVGNAGDFKGTSFADLSEHPAFSPEKLTITLLARPTKPGYLVDKDNQYALSVDVGVVSCLVVSKTLGALTADAPLNFDEWSFVSCVYDGASISLRAHAAGSDPTPSVVLHPGPLATGGGAGITLGADNPGHGAPFTGQLDHVLFFSDALSDIDLCALDPFCG